MKTISAETRWIWFRGEAMPKNFYLHFRKTLLLPRQITRATIRITADSRYQLFVNTQLAARGPARCDRRWQCLDQWDITGHLRRGVNAFAVLVHHYGQWTFQYMLGRGGLFAEVELESADGQVTRLVTDESWKVRPASAWEENLPRMSIQLGFPEVFDARKECVGWTEASFDDSDWEAATTLGPAGMEPWPRLVPRDIPAMTEQLLRPEKVIDSGDLGKASTGHYVDLLRVVWSTKNGVAYLVTFVWSPQPGRFEIHAGSQEAIRLWVNGEPVISHLVTRDPAPDQEIVPVQLNDGWNTILAKIVQGEGQWHFYFRLEGDGSEHLVYSRARAGDPDHSDALSPWNMIGPFESDGVSDGFERSYPPEKDLDFRQSYKRSDGQNLVWISAGVSAESMLTSVIMSREPRFPSAGKAFDGLSGIVTPDAPTVVYPGATHGRYIVVDFGREVAGYPAIEVIGAVGGETIDLGYAEILQMPNGDPVSPASGARGVVNPDRAGVHYADRYICRAGNQRFQTFDKRAFRYMQIDVRNLKVPISLGPVSMVFSTYPVSYRGAFECSDPLLNRIWEVGRWTVQLNMEDAYTDCPWRERGQWWGDARVQALVNYYAFGDLQLIRHGLRNIAQSQREDGWTMGIYPTEWSYGILPTFTLLWIIALHDYYLYSGDEDLLRELFPVITRVIPACERARGEHELLSDVPHWLFVDWADVTTAGESCAVNALYHGGLIAAADIARAIGEHARGTEYRDLARRIQSGMMTTLWDPSSTVFRDGWNAGALSMKVSEQANCWAVAFGAAHPELGTQIVNAIMRKNRATVRTGTPYFAHYVLTALAITGAHDLALEYIRKQWTPMLEWGTTTWWEQWEPKASFCHGWSSAPTWFLSAEVLGVQPAKPGWEEIMIAPHSAGLAWARGKVPTPFGDVAVAWENAERFVITVTVPRPARVCLPVGRDRSAIVRRDPGDFPLEVECKQLTEGRTEMYLSESGTYIIQC
jgi:alpha-L-rhamnosidase